MKDNELIAILKGSFLTYARAFARAPADVEIDIGCDALEVSCILRYAAADHDALSQRLVASDIASAYRALVGFLDARVPWIRIVAKP